MTYCVAIKVNEGLVFAADTRTHAGVDDVRTYNKMHKFEFSGDRVFVVLSAGNLATTQYVLAHAQKEIDDPEVEVSLRSVRHMFDAAEYLGQVSVRAQKQVMAQGQAGGSSGINVETTLILGGQIQGEEPAIYLIYPLGNCISASPETSFLQIGETKYGKPILDRFVRSHVKLEDAARCALVSLDSTMRSNISVGPPVDLALMPRGALRIEHKLRLDFDTPYYAQLKETWARRLDSAIRSLPKFDWEQQHALPLGAPEPAYDAELPPRGQTQTQHQARPQVQGMTTPNAEQSNGTPNQTF